MKIPEQPFLQNVVDRLSCALRIQDWDISIHVINGYEMARKFEYCTYSGMSSKDTRLNTADIYLNVDADDDWYETLVHELLHVQSTPLVHCAIAYFQEKHSYFDDLYEQFTEKQAQMFCKIYPLETLRKEIGDLKEENNIGN